MKAVGIVAEYNPFHTGHLYHLEKSRELTGCDYCIAAMSGDYVQRGTPAVADKWLRTEAALLGGCDLVLELPPRIAAASAPTFAEGGVRLLAATHFVDSISFGAEAESGSDLLALTDFMDANEGLLTLETRSRMRAGLTWPKAQEDALHALAPELPAELLGTPNNLLAIQYCLAIRRWNAEKPEQPLTPVFVPRRFAAHDDRTLNGSYASATALREAFRRGASAASGLPAEAAACIPPVCRPLMEERFGREYPLPESSVDEALIYQLLRLTPEELAGFADVGTDLANRIAALAAGYTTFEEFCMQVKTRNLTLTHVRRALLHILLQIRETPAEPAYLRVLGMRRDAGPLLSAIRRQAPVPVITKLSEAEPTPALSENIFASRLYSAFRAREFGTRIRNEYQKTMIIV